MPKTTFKGTYRGVNMFAIRFRDKDGNDCWAIVEGGVVTRCGVMDLLPDGWQAAAFASKKEGLTTRDSKMSHDIQTRSTWRGL